MPQSSYNKVIIDLAALRDNFRSVQKKAGSNVRILAIVKSDAYGHGLVRCAEALSSVGASHFGVAELDEGVALREAGITGEIIILLGCSDPQSVLGHNLTPVVFDPENIKDLSAAAVVGNTQIGVHLKIDVGMGRLGIMPEDMPVYVDLIHRLPGVFLAGVLGHFPMADQNQTLTMEQNSRFVGLVNNLADGERLDSTSICTHIANSAAAIQYPDTRQQMIRPGITLYGCYPADNLANLLDLRPVMSFKTRVVQVKDVPAGYGISYGHLFITERSSRLAVLPVGYADGYLRSLTGQAHVLIRGKDAPVCGRICMNACVVDITDIPDVVVGDEVVLLGRQGLAEISAVDIAGWMNTIPYEVLCLFGSNNVRGYVG